MTIVNEELYQLIPEQLEYAFDSRHLVARICAEQFEAITSMEESGNGSAFTPEERQRRFLSFRSGFIAGRTDFAGILSAREWLLGND